MTVIPCDHKDEGEEELFDICRARSMVLVTDDIKAVKRFGDNIRCLFSVHIIYILFRKDNISRDQALIYLDMMKTERDWRSNIISIAGKSLFDDGI